MTPMPAEAAEIEDLGLPTLVTGTVMETLADRERLATETIDFARGIDCPATPQG